MNNPVILEFEASTILSQVSTYNLLLETSKRLKRISHVDPELVSSLNELLKTIETREISANYMSVDYYLRQNG